MFTLAERKGIYEGVNPSAHRGAISIPVFSAVSCHVFTVPVTHDSHIPPRDTLVIT
jgi:hypothetical protein